MEILKQLSIDLSEKQNTHVVYAVQGEKNSRKIRVSLFQNGSSWNIDNESSVLISYKKPDGHGGMYDVLDNGETAFELDGSNSVTITLAEQVLTVPGKVPVLVSFVLEGSILSTFHIILDVSENPGIDVAESEDYFSLSVAIDAATRAAEEIIQKETFATQEYVNDTVERLRVSVVQEIDAIADDAKTFYVTISENEDGTLNADKTIPMVIGAFEAGRTVKAIVSIDGENVSVPLIGIIEGDTALYVGYAVYGQYIVVSHTERGVTINVQEFVTEDRIQNITSDDIGAIPVPSKAQVGQTIIVSEVDENGKPTKWVTGNIGSGGDGEGSSGNAVLYTPQDLTDEQKSQARKNIDSVDTETASSLSQHIDEINDWLGKNVPYINYGNVGEVPIIRKVDENDRPVEWGSLEIEKRLEDMSKDIAYIEGEIESGIPYIVKATIGQAVVVRSVNENGKPTEWETVDLPADSNGESYTLPVATPDTLGGVKPVAKTDDMTQPVGVDGLGGLWTARGGGGGQCSFKTKAIEVAITESVSEIVITITGEDAELWNKATRIAVLSYCRSGTPWCVSMRKTAADGTVTSQSFTSQIGGYKTDLTHLLPMGSAGTKIETNNHVASTTSFYERYLFDSNTASISFVLWVINGDPVPNGSYMKVFIEGVM